MAKNNQKKVKVKQQVQKQMSRKEIAQTAAVINNAVGDLLPALYAKQAENQQASKSIQGIKTPLDYAHPVKIWEGFGYTEFEQLKTNHLGEVVGPSGYKVIIKQNPKQNPFLRVTMPKGQPFTPEEPIDQILETLEQRLKDTYPDFKKDFGEEIKIEFIKKTYSHDEDIQHWLVQTNISDKIEGSYAGSNDQVKLGFVVRNGYNTDVSLGVDVFTFRLACSNGMIVKGTDLTKTSIRHVGKDPKNLLKAFHEALMLAVQEWAEVIELYNKMAKKRLTPEIAQFIYAQNSKMPKKYFPEYYNIPTKEEIEKRAKAKKPAPLITLTNEGKNVTLWQNYNDMSRKLWRARNPELNDNEDGENFEKLRKAKPISFYEVAWQETRLHRAMKAVFDNPEEFV